MQRINTHVIGRFPYRRVPFRSECIVVCVQRDEDSLILRLDDEREEVSDFYIEVRLALTELNADAD